ncbi:MAG: nucleotidyl transferase AbiEii/AbiGii toxin family protein [Candidatus Thorarchaeota archaeon]
MISESDLQTFARANGVPLSTVERDYAQNWLLAALTNPDMLLKGGTGIRKVYRSNYRFSDDLDFTLLEEVNCDNYTTTNH